MTEKTINCAECNVEFTFEENPKYPRKYCLNCSALKKKEFKGMSKTEAKVTPDNELGAPVEKPGDTYERVPMKPNKEYHLSPEAVRVGALDAAIKVTKKLGTEDYNKDLIEQAEEFERWINGR